MSHGATWRGPALLSWRRACWVFPSAARAAPTRKLRVALLRPRSFWSTLMPTTRCTSPTSILSEVDNQRRFGVGTTKSKKLKVDGVVIEKPRFHHAVFPSPTPATSPKFHLRVPTDVAVFLNAIAAHQLGHRGQDILVAMPDSGQYRHPFFAANGYNVKPTISVVPNVNPAKDPVGHGTGESANIFAVAPDCVLQAIRASNDAGELVGAIAGFLRAKSLNPKPRIITNSWGGSLPFPPGPSPDSADLTWAAEIRDAVEQGILVVFSAGNSQFSIEAQVPGVLAAGGVYLDATGNLRASDYASGYESPWFGGVRVPTVSGLVGMRPRAQYLMLPVQPNCRLDRVESLPDPPVDLTTDGTLPDDGWALFSGTSAAAPQLAGVAAWVLGAKPGLAPAQVIRAITSTAVDVVTGRCHPRFNNPAEPGVDLATGAGLANAAAAVQFARDNF
jgi:subtilisin family serine protease